MAEGTSPSAEPAHQVAMNGDVDDEETFQYPDDADGTGNGNEEYDVAQDSDEEFKYPASEEAPASEAQPGPSTLSQPPELSPQIPPADPIRHASMAQLEALYAAGLNGSLSTLRSIVEDATSSGELEPFTLVNDASPRTGLTVVHAVASRGHIKALRWCELNNLL